MTLHESVIITSPEWMRRFVAARRAEGRRIAFVPTMGYLHEGHLSLVEKAAELADCVIVSIFVNPMQFGPNEDLDRYPRDLDGDLQKLSGYPVQAVFCPAAKDLYPAGFQTSIHVERVSAPLCGAARPGHFAGVATVVLKFFNIVSPDLAVFGLKDYQQFQVIRTMVKDLDVPVEIVGCEIVRETDGLARSSRNVFLTPDQRAAAVILHLTLEDAATLISTGRLVRASEVELFLSERIAAEPQARIDYVSCRDAASLEAVDVIDAPVVLALAVFFGRTRLIDNCVISV
ncbi:pantoate--beta-alanine ligase [Myxococcota bacterium]|jgi:pantoate--beta-alanine ligase|nr:pantoate--beta-alanine ligase [Myxococcota bacterium]PKN26400.1 MAG: pantoate--beta-alanine ligase [Deltaproteobacteria bacterium HGW-Deltaproteobacteria-22]